MTFKREQRYIVVKTKDLTNVPQALQDEFNAALAKVESYIPSRQCVVVESDWPEYEPVWKRIEKRVMGEAALAEDWCVVSVPQDLIGAACFAIETKCDSPTVLKELRRYTCGDRS